MSKINSSMIDLYLEKTPKFRSFLGKKKIPSDMIDDYLSELAVVILEKGHMCHTNPFSWMMTCLLNLTREKYRRTKEVCTMDFTYRRYNPNYDDKILCDEILALTPIRMRGHIVSWLEGNTPKRGKVSVDLCRIKKSLRKKIV